MLVITIFCLIALSILNGLIKVKKEQFKKDSDFVVEINILRKESFARNFLGGIVKAASLPLIPMTYPKEYCAEIKVFDAKGRILKGI